jgi:O-acetyl-ADP-ribose deacetylase (regulator of RNase III)
VIVREGVPLRFHAVIHDLSLEPTWREEWIFTALVGILREAERRGLRTLALPLLGTTHGTLDPSRAAQLLRAALAHVGPGSLQMLWLVAPAGTGPEAFDSLREFGLDLRV